MADGYPRRTLDWHGRTLAYRVAGETGPCIVLIHGIGSSADTWGDLPEMWADAGLRVLAIDLPGHGESSRGPGDYSLGAMACAVRDLMVAEEVDRAHLVGHSLGGGVTLQCAYQFPERVDAIVLEASGGLGQETFLGLRAAALPGADSVLRLAVNDRTLRAAAWVGQRAAQVGVAPHLLSPRALETVRWLAEDDRRAAFLSTLRSVIDPRGQRVSALERLHMLQDRDVLIVWGDRDPMIPMAHGQQAHEMLPGSRFVVFPGSGHEPHVTDPTRFAELVSSHVLAATARTH